MESKEMLRTVTLSLTSRAVGPAAPTTTKSLGHGPCTRSAGLHVPLAQVPFDRA